MLIRLSKDRLLLPGTAVYVELLVLDVSGLAWRRSDGEALGISGRVVSREVKWKWWRGWVLTQWWWGTWLKVQSWVVPQPIGCNHRSNTPIQNQRLNGVVGCIWQSTYSACVSRSRSREVGVWCELTRPEAILQHSISTQTHLLQGPVWMGFPWVRYYTCMTQWFYLPAAACAPGTGTILGLSQRF